MDKPRLESIKKDLGYLMIVLSFASYGGLLLVPFASFSAEVKIILSSTLIILGEASFWIAVLILGEAYDFTIQEPGLEILGCQIC